MMHGGMLAGDHASMHLSPYPIFRKRLRVEDGGRKNSSSRCLFGKPDPIETHALLNRVQDRARLDFGSHWNFDPIIGLPRTHVIVDGIEKMEYSWTQVIRKEQEAEFRNERQDAELVTSPSSCPVQPMSTPVPVSRPEESERITVSPLESFSPPNVFMESRSTDEEGGMSPLGLTMTSNTFVEVSTTTPVPPCKRFISPAPSLKQRCITDYMKVKKASRAVKKVLR